MAIEYLNFVGLDYIHQYERMLKQYLVQKLSTIPSVVLYNKDSDSGILAFNIIGVSSMEVSRYLNDYHICVRAGNHCSKMLNEDMEIPSTVRVSLYFYNTKEEIDQFVRALQYCEKVFKTV